MSLNNILIKNNVGNVGINRVPRLLSELAAKCNGRHDQCSKYASTYKLEPNNPEFTQELFTKYLSHINSNNSSYNSCLSTYNGRHLDVQYFIIDGSSKFIIDPSFYGTIFLNISDNFLLDIIKNQIKLDNNHINKIVNCENLNTGNYGYGQTNLINFLMTSCVSKSKTIAYIFSLMNVDQFISIINKIKNSINHSNESIIADYIKSYSKELLNKSASCIQMIKNLPYKSSIIRELYKIVSSSTGTKANTIEYKQEILEKAIINLDKSLILLIMENSQDIKPTDKNVDSLISKAYVNSGYRGASNNKVIAEIMDIFIMCGLNVTKELIIKLLNKTCYISQIEKYGVKIDSDILYECSKYSYYPYKFDCKPPISVLIKECSKSDNLETIKKLKEYGGEFNSTCLLEACKNPKNGRTIKYLVNECGVKSNNDCIKAFQEAHHLEALDCIIKGYKPAEDEIASTKNTHNKFVEINKDSLVTILPRDITFDRNDKSIDFTLKAKIKKFFDYKKKTIKYIDIYELVLKYLIDKKLVISNYFILDAEIAAMLKLEACMVLHIDQLHNMISYFIDPV